MTPEQKIKWLILQQHAAWADSEPPAYPCENIDELYDAIVESDEHWDSVSEIRCSGEETNIPAPSSRHYESESRAAMLPDQTWVGWTYWFGGGKHGEPEAIDWIEDAYNVECEMEEKLVIVKTFSVAATATN